MTNQADLVGRVGVGWGGVSGPTSLKYILDPSLHNLGIYLYSGFRIHAQWVVIDKILNGWGGGVELDIPGPPLMKSWLRPCFWHRGPTPVNGELSMYEHPSHILLRPRLVIYIVPSTSKLR